MMQTKQAVNGFGRRTAADAAARPLGVKPLALSALAGALGLATVSYTHLTLPTIYSV